MNRMRKGWLLFCVVVPLLASACAGAANIQHIQLPQQYRMAQTSLTTTFERRVGRIALIDETGNLVIMDQTGGGAIKITRDAASGAQSVSGFTSASPQSKLALSYHWPVWSPDASQLAFIENTAQQATTSRVIELGANAVMVQHGDNSITIEQSDAGQTAKRTPNTVTVERQPSRVIIERSASGSILSSSIYVAQADGKSPLNELYSSDKGAIGYVDWSPDSSQIAFLAQTGQAQSTLGLVSKDAGKSRTLLTGVSAVWNWHPDGKTLLAKVDTSTTDNCGNLSILNTQADRPTTAIVQNTDLMFGSPAFSPDGNSMLLTVRSGGQDYLALADRQGNLIRKLVTVNGTVSFSWSPAGGKAAYIVQNNANSDSVSGSALPGGALHLLDVNTGDDKVLSQMPIIGFFWSPDGQRVAAFSAAHASDITKDFPGVDLTSAQPSSVVMLQTIEINTRAFRQLFYFEPTDDFSSMLSQFDRFSRSINLWSPDSHHLVLPVIYTNGQTTYNLIVETEATGSIEPRVLSQGTIAVWSPK